VSVTACLAGMATKEVTATAPLLVLLYDRTFMAGSFAGAWRQRRGYYLALAGTWLLLAWLLWSGGGARGASAGFGLGVSWWAYLLQQAEAGVLYLKLAIWPHPLVLDYGTAVAQSLADVWWQGVVVFCLLVFAFWTLFRKPAAGFLGAWFFVILAPSSSIVPLVTQTMAEHRVYLPLAAVVVPAVLAAHRYAGRRTLWWGAVVAIVFTGMTVVRNRDYRDAVAIWTDTVAKVPQNARAHNNLAWALQRAGRLPEALVHYAKAVALDPNYVTAYFNWGVALLDANRVEEAIACFESVVRRAPDHVDARVNLGNALVRARRAEDALSHYEAALRLQPGADVHFNLGIALAELERFEVAATQLQAALRLKPDLAEARYQLARLRERLGQLAEAERVYEETLLLAPNHVGTHRRLGLLCARTNRLATAAEHFRAVLRQLPADADAHANLGNVLLLQGRVRDAIAQYEEALRLRPDDVRTRENLQLARESVR
jgi:tetratricopeptide (TPR) repeat protein